MKVLWKLTVALSKYEQASKYELFQSMKAAMQISKPCPLIKSLP